MQNKLDAVISKIDDEIERKISMNKTMNENTYNAFMYLKDNQREINILMKKYPLNNRYSELSMHLKNKGYTYNENALFWYLFRNGYFNEVAKIFVFVLFPLVFAAIIALITHFYISSKYSFIVFINAVLIFAILMDVRKKS